MKNFILLFLISFLAQAQNVLFVGNSLTYSNNMPEILESIAKQHGVALTTKSVCFPNYAIEDHINDGIFQKLLATQKFEYVIIQQGPSSQPLGKQMLLNDGATVKKICDKYNAQLGYFMVWPSVQYYITFDKVIENHTFAAKQNNALLFPVGKIWKEYNTYKNKEALYDSDNFHPSKAGSFLAALTIFHQLHPTKELQQLSHKNYTQWIPDEDSFKLLLKLVSEIN